MDIERLSDIHPDTSLDARCSDGHLVSVTILVNICTYIFLLMQIHILLKRFSSALTHSLWARPGSMVDIGEPSFHSDQPAAVEDRQPCRTVKIGNSATEKILWC